ncbi:MAG: alpha/beta hydrolase [Verrucomicrobiota bacterium]
MSYSSDIVFIHGMWSTGEVAAPLQTFLQDRGFRLHCPTLPGHRQASSTSVDRLSIRDYFDAISGYIDSKEFAVPPILIGHSMGGLIAQMIASRRECGPVVLLNSAGPAGINHIYPTAVQTTLRILLKPLFWKRAHQPNWAAARFGLVNQVSEESARQVFEALRPESGRAFGELVFWFFDPNKTTRLPFASQVPMLIVSGGKDRITPPPVAHSLARLYPQADLATFPENAHWIFEEPGREKVFGHILKWIERFHMQTNSEAHHAVPSATQSSQAEGHPNRATWNQESQSPSR